MESTAVVIFILLFTSGKSEPDSGERSLEIEETSNVRNWKQPGQFLDPNRNVLGLNELPSLNVYLDKRPGAGDEEKKIAVNKKAIGGSKTSVYFSKHSSQGFSTGSSGNSHQAKFGQFKPEFSKVSPVVGQTKGYQAKFAHGTGPSQGTVHKTQLGALGANNDISIEIETEIEGINSHKSYSSDGNSFAEGLSHSVFDGSGEYASGAHGSGHSHGTSAKSQQLLQDNLVHKTHLGGIGQNNEISIEIETEIEGINSHKSYISNGGNSFTHGLGQNVFGGDGEYAHGAYGSGYSHAKSGKFDHETGSSSSQFSDDTRPLGADDSFESELEGIGSHKSYISNLENEEHGFANGLNQNVFGGDGAYANGAHGSIFKKHHHVKSEKSQHFDHHTGSGQFSEDNQLGALGADASFESDLEGIGSSNGGSSFTNGPDQNVLGAEEEYANGGHGSIFEKHSHVKSVKSHHVHESFGHQTSSSSGQTSDTLHLHGGALGTDTSNMDDEEYSLTDGLSQNDFGSDEEYGNSAHGSFLNQFNQPKDEKSHHVHESFDHQASSSSHVTDDSLHHGKALDTDATSSHTSYISGLANEEHGFTNDLNQNDWPTTDGEYANGAHGSIFKKHHHVKSEKSHHKHKSYVSNTQNEEHSFTSGSNQNVFGSGAGYIDSGLLQPDLTDNADSFESEESDELYQPDGNYPEAVHEDANLEFYPSSVHVPNEPAFPQDYDSFESEESDELYQPGGNYPEAVHEDANLEFYPSSVHVQNEPAFPQDYDSFDSEESDELYQPDGEYPNDGNILELPNSSVDAWNEPTFPDDAHLFESEEYDEFYQPVGNYPAPAYDDNNLEPYPSSLDVPIELPYPPFGDDLDLFESEELDELYQPVGSYPKPNYDGSNHLKFYKAPVDVPNDLPYLDDSDLLESEEFDEFYLPPVGNYPEPIYGDSNLKFYKSPVDAPNAFSDDSDLFESDESSGHYLGVNSSPLHPAFEFLKPALLGPFTNHFHRRACPPNNPPAFVLEEVDNIGNPGVLQLVPSFAKPSAVAYPQLYHKRAASMFIDYLSQFVDMAARPYASAAGLYVPVNARDVPHVNRLASAQFPIWPGSPCFGRDRHADRQTPFGHQQVATTERHEQSSPWVAAPGDQEIFLPFGPLHFPRGSHFGFNCAE